MMHGSKRHGAPWSHRPVARRRFLLGAIVCFTFASGAGMAAPQTGDSATSGQHGARHEQSGTGQGGKRAPQVHTGASAPPPIHPDAASLSRTPAERQGRAVTAAANSAGPAAGVPAVSTSHGTRIIVKAPAVAGVSGTIGHHTTATPAVGGPAQYDARKGAVMNGTEIRRKF